MIPEAAREKGQGAAVKRIERLVLLVVIGLGIWARFKGLAWHFTHIDDLGVAKSIVDSKLRHEFYLFGTVPIFWTYAPLQFLFTKLLVYPGQTYRDVLFWGRFPSAVLGSAGLFAAVWFYRRAPEGRFSKALIAVTLLALSLENIIHAKQMHNYALGVTAVLLLLILFTWNLEKPGPGRAAAGGLACAVLAACHYQILFFLPGFFLVVCIAGLGRAKSRMAFLSGWAAGGVLFAAGFYPVWSRFLVRHAHEGIPGWNTGKGMFLLLFREGAGPLEKAGHAAAFFVSRFFLVLQANTAFIPEDHLLYAPIVYYLFSILFVFGLVSYLDTASAEKRLLGLFWLCFLGVWFVLLLEKKIAFSPTRHSLVLLPFMAFTIAEGFGYLFDRLSVRRDAWREREKWTALALAAVFAILFTAAYGRFLAERRDPFNEEEIAAVLKRYDVDRIMRVNFTLQPVFMKSLSDYFTTREEGWPTDELLYRDNGRDDTLAWISHRTKLTKESFEKTRKELNTFILTSNVRRYLTGRRSVPVIEPHFDAYEVVFSKEIDSDVQIDFSRLTRNGANNFYFYVLRKKAAP